MYRLILATILAFPALAASDVIKCEFPDINVSTTYSMMRDSFVIEENGSPKRTIINEVSFQILGAGHFQLWDKNKKVILDLKLNEQGRDGQTPRSYPFTADWIANPVVDPLSDSATPRVSGCYSNFMRIRK